MRGRCERTEGPIRDTSEALVDRAGRCLPHWRSRLMPPPPRMTTHRRRVQVQGESSLVHKTYASRSHVSTSLFMWADLMRVRSPREATSRLIIPPHSSGIRRPGPNDFPRERRVTLRWLKRRENRCGGGSRTIAHDRGRLLRHRRGPRNTPPRGRCPAVAQPRPKWDAWDAP